MKRDFIQDILANLIVRRNKVLGEKKTMKKNYESLSLVDRNAYEEIIARKDKSHFYIFTAPFYAVFYLGLFGLVLRYAFNIEILLLMKPIVLIIFSWLKYFFLAWLFFLLVNLIELNNTRREILLKR